MPAHLLLGKLAGRAPAYVVAVLDRLVPPMQKTLTAKLKADAVKQEVGRYGLCYWLSEQTFTFSSWTVAPTLQQWDASEREAAAVLEVQRHFPFPTVRGPTST